MTFGSKLAQSLPCVSQIAVITRGQRDISNRNVLKTIPSLGSIIVFFKIYRLLSYTLFIWATKVLPFHKKYCRLCEIHSFRHRFFRNHLLTKKEGECIPCMCAREFVSFV